VRRFRLNWYALIIGFAIGMLVAMYIGQRKCSARGGQYERGIFWFTCITTLRAEDVASKASPAL
jgi:prolipoprotein diacylglyceryltransferase